MPSIIPTLPVRPDAPNLAAPILVSLATGPHYAVADGAVLYSSTAGRLIRLFDGPTSSFINNGTMWMAISSTHSGLGGALVSGSGVGNITNNGLAVVIASQKDAAGFEALGPLSATGTITNNGSLYVLTDGGRAAGIVSGATRHAIVNNGLIAVQADTRADDPYNAWFARLSGRGFGIWADMGNTIITNGAGGRILVEADRAIGIWTRGSISSFSSPYEIDNAGLIRAVSTEAGTTSVGLFLATITGHRMRVINSGTIEADQAIFAPSTGPEGMFARQEYGVEEIHNTATGVVRGDIDLRNGNDYLRNLGLIEGRIDMGPGNDVVDMRGGRMEGTVYLGLGNDTFFGTAFSDFVTGERGDDYLEGFAGNDLLLGGYGDDTLIGGLGNDALYGEAGNDRIVTQGGDVVDGGAGDDRIEIGDFTFASIDGGAGFDTLVLNGGSRHLDLSAALATGRIRGIEQIVLNGQMGLAVCAQDVAMLGVTELRIGGSATDTVALVGTWVEGATRTINGQVYRSFTSLGSTILVQQTATVVFGDMPPGYGGLDPVAPGPPPPVPTVETELVADTGFTSLFDSFELSEGTFRVESGEHWHSFEGQAVFFANARGNLDNAGILSSAGNAEETRAVLLYNGNLTNFGTIHSDNFGDGASRAMTIGASGQILNRGAIVATAWNGDAIAVQTFQVRGEGVVNHGVIAAASTHGYSVGVSNRNATWVVNEGLIEAYGGGGAIGLEMHGQAMLTNRGTIFALAGDTYSVGVLNYGAGQIDNSGSIIADVAILAVTPYGETFAIHNSGYISGTINLVKTAVGGIYGRLNITNTNMIEGDIYLDERTETRDTIVNSGIFYGDAFLAGGDDIYDGARGVQTGAIYGEGGNDRLTGGAWADRLSGGTGNDILDGRAGDDVLDGGDGDDMVIGGTGSDRMTGGAGNDLFVFTTVADSGPRVWQPEGAKFIPDLIVDFVSGQDRIDLSAIDANSTTPANDAFTFIGEAAFSGRTGELRFEVIGGRYHILADVDGDGIADMHIIAQTPALSATDFVL